MRNIEWQ